MKNAVALLKYLAERAGADSLPDLRTAVNTPRLVDILEEIPLEQFSAIQWYTAANYLTGEKEIPARPFEVRDYLIGWCTTQPMTSHCFKHNESLKKH